ncbi:MAG: aldehyde dehydrogenase family protein, partial [Bdellovibrio sp.]|nr:aldehyde dehydrogenase family protein [Bdellovibrio sp.]
MELFNFIGGEFVASVSGKTFSKYSPFDNSELAQVADSDAMDVITSLQVSKKAFAAFEPVTLEQRAGYLNALADHFEKKASEIAYQEALHQGLPKSFVLKNSVEVAIQILRDNAKSVIQPLPEGVLTQAAGIVGIITSWSLSLRLVTERLAPALAAGNAVIVKVSEHSPITAKVLGEACKAAQIPMGMVQ